MNTMTFEKLQYNELMEEVKSYCVSELGKQLLDQLQPSSHMKKVKNQLSETTEARNILNTKCSVPLIGLFNIENMIEKLEEGVIFNPTELMDMSTFLKGCRKMKDFMLERALIAPVLSLYAQSMSAFTSIEEEINFSIKGNKVDSAASKELKRIRSRIQTTGEKIEDRLNKFLKSSANKEYIQEFFISKKDDRYTIPIKASYKNHVTGTIVETSSKGVTVFIEPASITKLTTELATLKAEEAMEEYQILATLSGMIFEEISSIMLNIERIGQYDMIFAKAKHSEKIGGIEPRLNSHGYIQLIKCKHPLLHGEIVPLDFEIGKSYRSLVITGPNAGGKTVVLKTVGLLTLATMSGLHIAADPASEIAVFDHIFVDIGDNQNMENALSTFSSHVSNISEIMRAANNNTLLLFDEIGSGTEPNEGAALAIAILEAFYHMGCMTVATTHYGEIKRYSEMHIDFMNAAMQFNSETLSPLYKLLIGKSGESNAFWISRKMKIQEHIIQKAQVYMKNKDYRIERVNKNIIRKSDDGA